MKKKLKIGKKKFNYINPKKKIRKIKIKIKRKTKKKKIIISKENQMFFL
jgi:hypothetical protein